MSNLSGDDRATDFNYPLIINVYSAPERSPDIHERSAHTVPGCTGPLTSQRCTVDSDDIPVRIDRLLHEIFISR